MLANTLTIGGIVLTRIDDSDKYTSVYRFGDSTHEMRFTVRHNVVSASTLRAAYHRHNFELLETVYASGGVPEYQRKVYVVSENLPSDTSIVNAAALATFMLASSSAFLTSMVALES